MFRATTDMPVLLFPATHGSVKRVGPAVTFFDIVELPSAINQPPSLPESANGFPLLA
jgi:hypothetical protein